jgi:hypothetical protein
VTEPYDELPARARAEFDACEHGPRLYEAVEAFFAAAGVELNAVQVERLRAITHTHTRETYLRGAEREAGLLISLSGERSVRRHLETALRSAGLPVPTARRPTPPPGTLPGF